ncbi:MAG: hypothetical protein ACOC32_01460 [Nanoarchaeota archaeon]
MNKGKTVGFIVGLLLCSAFVLAAENETVPSTMNITGNLPRSTVFFNEAGDQGDGSISLVPNSTQLLSCWGTAYDLDGFGDLNELINATIFAESSFRFAPENESTNYMNNTCDTTNLHTTGEWNCTFNVQYFAENSTWTCMVNITNQDTQYYNDTISTTAVIEDLVAIDVLNSTIDFGLRAVTENYTADTRVEIANEGNVELDLQLDAFNQTASFADDNDQAFNCSIGHIPVNYLRFSLDQDDAYLDSLPLSASGATSIVELNLSHREGGAGTFDPTTAPTYWAIAIPANIAGTCNGQILYIGRPS